MRSGRSCLLCLVVAIGGQGACGSSDPPAAQTGADAAVASGLLAGFTPGAPAAGEIQIVSPIVRGVPVGADVQWCSYLPFDAGFASDLDIVHATGFQSATAGHHAILYAARARRAVDTHECTDDDMANAVPLGITGAEGGDTFVIPRGLALRGAAGTQLFFRTHWVNTTNHPIDGQAAFNLRVQPRSQQLLSGSLFSVVATQFSIPARANGHAESTCTFAGDVRFATLYGHAHEWGKRVRIYAKQAGTERMLYDRAWTPHDASAPPGLVYELGAPLVFHPGDTLRVACDFSNTTDGELAFPTEMCAAAGLYFPGDVQRNCVDGAWPGD